MACLYKDRCPNCSAWYEGPKLDSEFCYGPEQDFSRCAEVLLTAYENEVKRLENVFYAVLRNGRECKFRDCCVRVRIEFNGFMSFLDKNYDRLAIIPLTDIRYIYQKDTDEFKPKKKEAEK